VLPGHKTEHPDTNFLLVYRRVVDPDPDPRARKRRNFRGKMHFLIILLKKFLPLKRYKIALTTY
jgi:hypothetical protein